MDTHTVHLVQNSWKKVIPIADQAMEIFYAKLFAINPSTRAMFPAAAHGMAQQRNKLRDMLVVAVNGLSNPTALLPALKQLGARHVAYGVEAPHYADVGAALLGTLEAGLGDDFTPEVRAAWTEVYGVLSGTMLAGAQEAVA